MKQTTVKAASRGLRAAAAATVLSVVLASCGGSDEPELVTQALPESSQLPAADGPLSISGSPETRAMAYGFYEFVPDAVHTNDEGLSFSATNKPAWADFDEQTGILSGIPESTDAGTSGNIVISATDGTHTVALPGFAIEVFIPELTSVTISWVPPNLRMDGSPLTNLARYTVHYGTDPFRLPHRVDVESANGTTVFIGNIPAGRTYYFTVRAIDAFDNRSRYSDFVQVAL